MYCYYLFRTANNPLLLPISPCCVAQLEKCSQDLGNSTKAVSSAIAQLLSEATQGNENYTGKLNNKPGKYRQEEKLSVTYQILILIKICLATKI